MRLLREARYAPTLKVLVGFKLIMPDALGVDMLLLEVGMCFTSEKLKRIELSLALSRLGRERKFV